ncbi:MAG: NUDIX hydrolase, partial [Selenomonadales bacterium]|nr:NUDIX hydrolase [Selenomonadales bacterium]
MEIRDRIEAFKPMCPQEDADRALALKMIEEYPDNVLTRDNLLAHFTSSGFVVNETLDKVLMVHHLI